MKKLSVTTHRHTEFINVTAIVQQAASESGVKTGTVTVFCPHTTAGLTINENADPDVVADLTTILDRTFPWEAGYRHAEGNSAAHMKASVMGASVRVIIEEGRLQLGTWQSIYFCEFDGPRSRQVWVTTG